jgi:uncharacterized protein (DUF2235 family)
MALYAFDGTGNEDRDGDLHDTNVLEFFRAYDDPLKNTNPGDSRGSLYVKGIGTMAHTFLGDKVAEAFGIGGHRRVREGMRRLLNNIKAGDTVVDIVGFSRGAGIAISFANEITEVLPDVRIRFIGLWDLVGEFGLPGEHLQAGHNLGCPLNCTRGYHAMALDENRLLFPLTRMRRDDKPVASFTEVWFRGVHSDVGGGNGNRGLNWIPLNWMFKAALREGVPIAQAGIDKNLLDRELAQTIGVHDVAAGGRRPVIHGDLAHISVQPTPSRPTGPEYSLDRMDDEGVIQQVQV